MAAADHTSVASLLLQPSAHQGSPPPSNASDSLICHWVGCGEHASSPEALYEHVCERHVGRKSTNNLNLQCQWGSCRTTTVKRDHITSHIRVHVPLKPHKCDFCGKSFKRPQDLKKHVKTHADDSILLRSPGATGAQHGYHQGIAKGTSAYDGALRNALTKLSAQAGNGYYPDAATAGAGGPYGYNQAYSHNGIAAQAGGVHGYGGGSYAIPNVNLADGGSIGESRKRGHDMLEQFFSDAKRRQIDANSYMDLGARFGGLHGLQIGLAPGFGGYNMGYGGVNDDYGSTAAAMAQYSHASQPYAMFNELKTKSDLMSIDHFLEQLQNTVYENPGRSSSTNIQPGLDAMGPSQGGTPSYSDSRAPSLVEDTPTPASNYSTNSPASVHSSFNNRSSGTGYPQLPSVSALAEMQPSGFNGSGVPSSGIAEYDSNDNRRRFSSNFLTRANLPKTEKEDGHSPSSTRSDDKDAQAKEFKKAGSSSPKADSDVTLPPIRNTEAERSEEERNEAWVENMRVIEHLRHYVQDRLKHKEFDDGEGRSSSDGNRDGETTPKANRSPEIKDVEMTDREKEVGSLYPVLRAVQAAD